MFVLAVIMGSSMSYLTTFGYQTNLIVAGLAGYRARDFLPLGSALTLLLTTGLVLATLLAIDVPPLLALAVVLGMAATPA